MAEFAPQSFRRNAERGIVLLWALVFITLLALGTWYAVEYATQSTKIATFEQDQLTARAAAEAALNDAQQYLAMVDTTKKPGAQCDRDGSLRSQSPTMTIEEFPGFDKPDVPGTSCRNGQCAPKSIEVSRSYSAAKGEDPTSPAVKGLPWWPKAKGGIWGTSTTPLNCDTPYSGATPLGFYTGAPPLLGVSRQPEYIIEYINPTLYSNFLPVIASGQTINFQCQVPINNASANSYASFSDTTPAITTIAVKCLLFRITATGFGTTGNNEVMLQTFVSKATN